MMNVFERQLYPEKFQQISGNFRMLRSDCLITEHQQVDENPGSCFNHGPGFFHSI